MKTLFSCSFLAGAILGFSVLIGQIETVVNREYPVVIENPTDDWIMFAIPYVGGFGGAAAIYSYLALKND
jgi:hypothetical protein